MRKLFYLLLLAVGCAGAQESLLPVRIMATPKAAPQEFVGTDAFGWEYVVADNEFRKQKDGKVYKYKNVSLGDITRADLQNPLQLVLFYKKFNTVVLLDNQLNETGTVNFNELPTPVIVDAVGLASQNRLWVYDITTQQTGLFDLKKGTFRTLTPPNNNGVSWYQNDYNYFYWTDSKNDFYTLNLFGSVTAGGTIPPFKNAQRITDHILLLQQDNSLVQYDLSQKESKPLSIVEKSFGAFYYKDGILSIFTENEIVQYKITLPRE